jgi:hypothetical protein
MSMFSAYCLGGQADLVTDDAPSRLHLARNPGRLDRVGLDHAHLRVGEREEPDLGTDTLCLVKGSGGGLDLLRGHVSSSSATTLRNRPIPSASTSTTSPGFSQIGGSKRAPAPVGVPVTITSPGTSVANVET